MTEPDAIQRARKAVRGRYGADAAAEPAEVVYQVRFGGHSTAWHDSTEAAWHTFTEKNRRMLYLAAPAQAAAVPAKQWDADRVRDLLNLHDAGLGREKLESIAMRLNHYATPQAAAVPEAVARDAADKWERGELWHALAKANHTNAYVVRDIVLGYLEATASGEPSLPLSQLKRILDKDWSHGTPRVVSELRLAVAAIDRLAAPEAGAALSQGDVSGDGEGS